MMVSPRYQNNGLVFNPAKKMVVSCYADANFSGLWGHENPQDPICTKSRTGFMVTSCIVGVKNTDRDFSFYNIYQVCGIISLY